MKTFSFERFLKAAYKVFSISKTNKLLQENPVALKESFIFVRSNNEDVKLNLDEIIRINAMKDHIIIYTVTRKLIVHQTMKSIMQNINLENLIRVHNSHIISLNHLQSVGKNSIVVANERIPVSEKYKAFLTEFIDRLSKSRFYFLIMVRFFDPNFLSSQAFNFASSMDLSAW